MNDVDLEPVVGAALARLPAPQAPPTLLPRVLAAVARYAQRPWYARAWVTWPTAWQAVSIGALATVIAAVTLVAPAAHEKFAHVVVVQGGPVIGEIARAARPITEAASGLEAVTGAIRTVWRVVYAPAALYAAGLLVLMFFSCAAFVAALVHVTSEKVLQR